MAKQVIIKYAIILKDNKIDILYKIKNILGVEINAKGIRNI